MKRFLVFCYDDYERCGGWNDYWGCFCTLDQAEKFIEDEKYDNDGYRCFHQWHIVDLNYGKIVKKGFVDKE